MSDASENVRMFDPARNLAEAMRTVKNAEADREDVVVEMRDAERMRLEILANELSTVIAEVPAELDIFDFALSSGLKPRLWIDSVSHVSMGRDKRTYRFLKDTRNGRVILAESTDPKPVADQVTRYIAERMVERERMMEGGLPLSYRSSVNAEVVSKGVEALDAVQQEPIPGEPVFRETVVSEQKPAGLKSFFWGLAIFILGGLFGLAMLSSYWWDIIARQ